MIRGMRPQRIGYIYVIGKRNGLCKIGRSVNPSHRASQLRKGGAPLSVLAQITTSFHGGYHVERSIHVALATQRKMGEWFDLSDEDIALLAAIGTAQKSEDLPELLRQKEELNRPQLRSILAGIPKASTSRAMPAKSITTRLVESDFAKMESAIAATGETVAEFTRRAVIELARLVNRPSLE